MPVPPSTYRLQLSGAFTLLDAASLVDYLADLGAGALYASPLLESGAGSNHGYDVVDPTVVSAERGGEQGREALVAALRAAGLGLLVDLVPNHVGVAEPQANPWWWDVLRHGPDSACARFFDVDWDRGPILVPLLADDGDGGAGALADLRLESGPDGERLAYHEHVLPVAPGTGGGSPAEVHERQHYRLVSWRRGASELTYRKFFDVATLAAVRVEDPEVFDAAHALVRRWLADGEVDGLRVDHPDGLADPAAYLRRLRAAAPGAWLLVEKILHVGESLPASWPVDGTTGYDALREVCGLFVDPAGEAPLTALTGDGDLAALSRDCKRLVASTLLLSEVRRIARRLQGLQAHGVPIERAEAAVTELLCAFPVYRSYLPEGRWAAEAALSGAAQARPDLAEVFDVLRAEVFGDPRGELATRVQQTAPMVMAKGVEDTAFYRYNRLVALNEVGGAPDRFGVSVEEFHTAAAARDAGWPATMTTLSTHDTKRSEDVRARIAALSELPSEFGGAYRRWSARSGLPEPSLDLLAWQTLVGAWPIPADRLRAYLVKASKEAKVRTTHTDPDAAFDAAVAGWADSVLGDADLCAEVAALVERVRPAGWSNSLGQKLLQLAGPGVPDVYQGTELWDNSLVDPDNRRPVDFPARRDLLARLDAGWLPPVDDTGAAKLLVTSRVLRLRRDQPGLFRGYRPLYADGPAASHAVAFTRSGGVVAVATRLPIGLAAAGGWRDTVLALPGASWVDALTGTTLASPVPLADLLGRYPVALLVRGPEDRGQD